MSQRYIAMWSGPRNVSTALMRSFESRADTRVVDEPLYAHYLQETGLEHPGREEILARHEPDWRKVVAQLTAPLPEGTEVFYQKHMAHHLLPEIEVDWLEGFEQAFLIRQPRAMLPSLEKVLGCTPRLEDTGFPQQVRLFDSLAAGSSSPPAVVDSTDLLRDPRRILTGLCERVGLEFDPAMLSWAEGPRESDGCWGPIWYAGTYASTGFKAPGAAPASAELSPELERVAEQAQPLYDHLYSRRIGA